MRRERSKNHPASNQPRLDRQPESSDSYGTKGKLPDPTLCTQCGAVYKRGRWTWQPAPADAGRSTCPACHRLADDQPAGIVTLRGDFLAAHRAEILALARNHEEHEKAEHPLERILRIDEPGGAIEIRTTTARLARGLGEAIHHAYSGDLVCPTQEAEGVLRVAWER